MIEPNYISKEQFIQRLSKDYRSWIDIINSDLIDDHKSVKSSMVSSIGYSHEYGILNIHYHRGGNWLYFKVPLSIYEYLLGSESIGKSITASIKGVYEEYKFDNN